MYSLAKQIQRTEQNDKLDFSEILSCIYFAICFWEPYLNQLIGSVTKYFLIVIIIIMAINKDKLYFRNYHLSVFIWFLMRIISIPFVGFNVIIRANIISMIGMVLFFIVITATKHSRNFVKYLSYTCYASSFSICFASLFFSQQSFVEIEQRIVLTVFGVQADPNNESALKLFCFVFAIMFAITAKKYKWIHIAAALISAYTIFLTGSRGGMVAMVVALVLTFFCVQSSMPFTRKFLILACVIVLAIVFLFIAKRFLPQSVFERLFDFSMDDGNARTGIWSKYLPLFYRSPIWGSGWASYWGYKGGYAGCHNIYLEVLVETGIIGFLTLFYPIGKAIFYSMKKRGLSLALGTLMASELVISFFLGAINKRFFWLPFIMCIIEGLNSYSEVKK